MEDLRQRISKKYDTVDSHVKIRGRKRDITEVDLIGRRGKEVDIYEVKCSYRVHKAKKQLKLAYRLLGSKKGHLYFYCGSSGVLEQMANV